MKKLWEDRSENSFNINIILDRDSSVGIATRYELDGPGSGVVAQVNVRFSASVQTGPGTHPAPQMGNGSLPRG